MSSLTSPENASFATFIGDRNSLIAGRVTDTVTRAVFDGVVIADSDDVRNVEGMTYFPIESVDMDALVESPTTSRCFWKGKAPHWHVPGHREMASHAAFTYEHPWPLARPLVTRRIALWQGVQIVND